MAAPLEREVSTEPNLRRTKRKVHLRLIPGGSLRGVPEFHMLRNSQFMFANAAPDSTSSSSGGGGRRQRARLLSTAHSAGLPNKYLQSVTNADDHSAVSETPPHVDSAAFIRAHILERFSFLLAPKGQRVRLTRGAFAHPVTYFVLCADK